MARNTSSGKGTAPKAGAKKHALPKPASRSAPSPKSGRKPEAAKQEAKRVQKVVKPVKKAVVKKTAPPAMAPKAQPKPASAKGPLSASNGAPKPPPGKATAVAGRPSPTTGAGTIAAAHVREADGAISVAAKGVTAKAVGGKPMPSRPQAPPAPRKPVHQRHGFKTNEWIVYPSHGVGRIVGIEEQEIAGMSLELFVITFEKDKMTLRVPTGKSSSVGMRKLAEEGIVKRAMETLKGRARIKRTMWSRRAQEYEAKINSGDLIAIAEVVRDLYRSESQPEQSYSERQLYEAALDRMAREIAAVEKLDERGATQRITEVLAKSAKGRRVATEEAESKAA
jgi:CarD family transcriptional regulator